MGPECCFILPSGKKCRCAATRNQAVCRHHAPKPAFPGPPPVPKCDVYSRHNRWTRLGRNIPWLDSVEIPSEIYEILCCLIEDGPRGISDREAGRLLRGLLRRLGSVPFPIPEPPGMPSPAQPPAPARPFDPRMTAHPNFDPEFFRSLVDSLRKRAASPHQVGRI